MDFSLSAEQQALIDTTRKFAAAELPDLARTIEQTNSPPPRGLLKRYAELGLMGINLPAEYGGAGMGHLEAALALEELAKISCAIAFPVFESSFGPALAIAHFAPEEMRRRILPQICSGDMVLAVSMSEPQAGTALTDLKTRATLHGDRVIVNGTKRWCSGAGHADAYLVYCRMSDAPGANGIGAVLIEKDTQGFSFGAAEQHMGFRGIPSADMFFDAVEIPAANIVVPAGGLNN